MDSGPGTYLLKSNVTLSLGLIHLSYLTMHIKQIHAKWYTSDHMALPTSTEHLEQSVTSLID